MVESTKNHWRIRDLRRKDLARVADDVMNSAESHTEIGNNIIKLLGLTQEDNGRVNTCIGTKSPEGLARTIMRCYTDEQFPG